MEVYNAVYHIPRVIEAFASQKNAYNQLNPLISIFTEHKIRVLEFL
jgi:hypothetical protein